MKFKIPANKPPLYRSFPDGDRQVQPGEIFEVDEHELKKYQLLESKGLIERYIPRSPLGRKAYTVYENKIITPQNK